MRGVLLALEGFAGGGELHALEHGVLVRQLVDGGLLVGEVALVALELLVLERHAAGQRASERALAVAAVRVRPVARRRSWVGMMASHDGERHSRHRQSPLRATRPRWRRARPLAAKADRARARRTASA